MLEPKSLVDLACDEIRSLIARGVLGPDERVFESKLVEQLRISRSPLREALRILETQHVVRLTPRRGYTVVPLSQEDIDEIYAVRAVLEDFGMRLAIPRLAGADLTQLEAVTKGMRKAAEHGDDRGMFQSTLDFHIALVDLAGNTRLEQTYKLLMDQMQLYVYWDVSEEARSVASLLAGYQRHAIVLEAVRTADPGRIAAALVAHGERRHLESAPSV